MGGLDQTQSLKDAGKHCITELYLHLLPQSSKTRSGEMVQQVKALACCVGLETLVWAPDPT